ncbi:hypothetical protein E3J79_03575 [Candidatus Dependentiae bacterium]|nr:MAG: hypothetical protein E3J79_03575 [Candidatus Dependentiae bacterium]
MTKCLKITFSKTKMPPDFLRSVVQKHAKKLDIEGIAKVLMVDQKICIIACGVKDNIDAFVDLLHKRFSEFSIHEIKIEPFIRDKDYRNVFRIIE